MKFCKPKSHEYAGIGGTVTSYHYVLEDDVEAFHGHEFTKKWKEYIVKKPCIVENGEQRYYYADYKECVYMADCWFV